MIPMLDEQIQDLIAFPEINALNFTQRVKDSCDSVGGFIESLMRLQASINTVTSAIDSESASMDQKIAEMERLKQDIITSAQYIDLEVLQQIKDEMDLINLVAADAALIQDTAGLVRSVKLNYISKNSDYTAVHNDYIFADTSADGFSIALPSIPSIGEKVFILDTKGTFTTNNLTILRNGNTIMGESEDMILNVKNIEVKFIFTDNDWRIT